MRFCLECGNALGDAPLVVNLQNDTAQNQTNVRTDSFGQQQQQQFGNQSGSQSGNQYVPPNYPTGNRGGKSNTKIFLAVGGVLALILLLFMGVAAIVVYNVMNKEKVELKPTPTPTSSRSVAEDSPTPASSATPKASPGSTRKSTLSSDENTTNDSGVTVQFDDVTTDYNVQEDDQKGMRMRTSFTVNGMKGQDGYLAIHFQKRDGEPLPAGKGKYRDVNGNLAVFRELKPDYDETLYKDLESFLPYDELNLPVGKHDLRMDVDLLDGKGVTLQHMTYENFWYEQK